MELILISDSKLKIILTPEDMKKHGINCDDFDYCNTQTRRVFWNILDRAKKKTGFDAASERVYIQFYSSRDGGGEMYVTKICNLDAKKEDKSQTQSPSKKDKNDFLAYAFTDIEKLLLVCRILNGKKKKYKSRAYSDADGNCMLFIGLESDGTADALLFIDEFASRTDSSLAFSFANEHYSCICRESAIETLARFA